MSDLQTATEDSTRSSSAVPAASPVVLIADLDPASCARRADQLRVGGFHVALARTPFEVIVKASCQVPDLILIDSSFGVEATEETTELLTTCPATAHIPIVCVTAGRRLPKRVFAGVR